MFLLVTGASGAGKSTVRRRVAPAFADVLQAAELATLGVTPQWSLAWRHEMVERMVQWALEIEAEGRHFLLCGDPVPPGEVLAAPSADRLGPLAVCLLDVAPDAQRTRLIARGDDPTLLEQHHAFAAWMRGHVTDHRHRPEVITGGGWEQMQWNRWLADDVVDLPWSANVIDTSRRDEAAVSAAVSDWIHASLSAR